MDFNIPKIVCLTWKTKIILTPQKCFIFDPIFWHHCWCSPTPSWWRCSTYCWKFSFLSKSLRCYFTFSCFVTFIFTVSIGYFSPFLYLSLCYHNMLCTSSNTRRQTDIYFILYTQYIHYSVPNRRQQNSGNYHFSWSADL